VGVECRSLRHFSEHAIPVYINSLCYSVEKVPTRERRPKFSQKCQTCTDLIVVALENEDTTRGMLQATI